MFEITDIFRPFLLKVCIVMAIALLLCHILMKINPHLMLVMCVIIKALQLCK